MADDQIKSVEVADTMNTTTSTTTSNPPADSDRRAKLEILFSRNYAAVAEAASAPGLFIVTADALIEATGNHLDSYSGLANSDDEFIAWITENVRPAAERLAAFHAIKAECESYVYKAIRNVLDTALDLGVDIAKRDEAGAWGNTDTAGELAQETWAWAFMHLDELLIPGSAKLTSRMYARARWTARAWKQSRLRERERFPYIGDIARLGRDERGELFMEPLPILSPDGDAGALYS